MTTWNELKIDWDILKNDFNTIFKRLNKNALPKENIVNNHINDLVSVYNQILQLYVSTKPQLTSTHVYELQTSAFGLRDRLVSLFSRLKRNVLVPLDLDSQVDITVQDPNFQSSSGTDSDPDSSSDSDLQSIMTQTPADAMTIVSRSLNKNYAGDPLGLSAFINTIELLEDLVEAANTNVLLRAIISKLEGKAHDALPANPPTIQAIKDALKANIKPDNSEIIEGRITALRSDHMSAQDFAKTAEELADSLKRTLIIEGMPPALATKHAVKKTVELCRASTRTNVVKSVLAAASFNDPKEVIAKYLVESATDVKERQVLSFNSYRGNQRGRVNHRGRYNNNNRGFYHNQRGNYQNSWTPRNNNNYGNNSGNNNNGNRHNSGYGNNQTRNNYRGRGRSNYNGNNNRNQSVRFAEAGNSNSPQQRTLGETEPTEQRRN